MPTWRLLTQIRRRAGSSFHSVWYGVKYLGPRRRLIFMLAEVEFFFDLSNGFGSKAAGFPSGLELALDGFLSSLQRIEMLLGVELELGSPQSYLLGHVPGGWVLLLKREAGKERVTDLMQPLGR